MNVDCARSVWKCDRQQLVRGTNCEESRFTINGYENHPFLGKHPKANADKMV